MGTLLYAEASNRGSPISSHDLTQGAKRRSVEDEYRQGRLACLMEGFHATASGARTRCVVGVVEVWCADWILSQPISIGESYTRRK